MRLLIKEAIKEKGYTIQYVAEQIGTSKQSLSNVLKNGNPVIGTVAAIARVLDVPITALIDDERTPVELTALVHFGNQFYHATDIAELEAVVESIKAKRAGMVNEDEE